MVMMWTQHGGLDARDIIAGALAPPRQCRWCATRAFARPAPLPRGARNVDVFDFEGIIAISNGNGVAKDMR